MGYFTFLKRLDESLYQRCMSIEDSIKTHNGNVFLNMQMYLEHLFKYVSRRQGYNIHQNKKLGELLNDYRIENFCHLNIEYDKIHELKQINHYGNNYKHNELLEFNFDKFMYLMQEIYCVSIKIYNYYNNQKINQIIPLNRTYYLELMAKNEHFEKSITSLQGEISQLKEKIKQQKETIIEGNKKLTKLEALNKELKKENKKLARQLEDAVERCNRQQKRYEEAIQLSEALANRFKWIVKNEGYPYRMSTKPLNKRENGRP